MYGMGTAAAKISDTPKFGSSRKHAKSLNKSHCGLYDQVQDL